MRYPAFAPGSSRVAVGFLNLVHNLCQLVISGPSLFLCVLPGTEKRRHEGLSLSHHQRDGGRGMYNFG